ncbi:MAG: PilZ domain-containing protein [Firmicutes bacterium]|nr:PilZ domain-containing protein [Bacillota bacterium]
MAQITNTVHPVRGDTVRIVTDQGIFPARMFEGRRQRWTTELIPAYLTPRQRVILLFWSAERPWRVAAEVERCRYDLGFLVFRIATPPTASDPRQHPRFPWPWPADLYLPDGQAVAVPVSDLSLGGCRVTVPGSCLVGARLVIGLRQGGEELLLPSVVVWRQFAPSSRDQGQVGLMFVNLARPDRAVLASWLQSI